VDRRLRTPIPAHSPALTIRASAAAPPVLGLRREDLSLLTDLVEAGKLTPVITRTYPLTDAATALTDTDAGHGRGKTVITIQPRPPPLRQRQLVNRAGVDSSTPTTSFVKVTGVPRATQSAPAAHPQRPRAELQRTSPQEDPRRHVRSVHIADRSGHQLAAKRDQNRPLPRGSPRRHSPRTEPLFGHAGSTPRRGRSSGVRNCPGSPPGNK
jgi:hypothetical protein